MHQTEAPIFNGNKSVTGFLRLGGATGGPTTTKGLLVPVAPTASANYGLLSIGSGAWDGATAGFFVGSASGTHIAVNAVSGFGGNLLDLQVAGAVKCRVTAAGVLHLPQSTPGAPALVFDLAGGTGGIYGDSGGRLCFSDSSSTGLALATTNTWRFGSGMNVGWCSGEPSATAADVTLSRISTASLAVSAGRFSTKQGAAVASATQVTLGTDGNTFHITGTTQTDLILNTGWQGGSIVTLIFDGAVTVRHNQAASGNFKPIMLSGAANFVSAADNVLQLVYDSTNAKWYEVSRKV